MKPSKTPRPNTVFIVRLDNVYQAKVGNQTLDFGSYQMRKVVQIDEVIGRSLVKTMPSIYALVEPGVLDVPAPARTTPPNVKKVSEQLAGMVKERGDFCTDLADELRKTRGNVFALTGALTLEEIVTDIETRAMTVIDNASWGRLQSDMTALRAEVAELRTRGEGFAKHLKA